MNPLEGKSALVTGAASGIGRAMATALAQRGVRLFLVDVDEEGLRAVEADDAVRPNCMMAAAVDVSERADMANLAERVHTLVPCVDLLVNNAGVYLTGGLLDLSLDDWDWVLSTNLWGVIYGLHYFVPPMVKHGTGGHVVNISSMYGYWTSPGVIGYLTAKFGVFGLSEALREELRGSGIAVSTVCPGIIRTNITKNMRILNAEHGDGIRLRIDDLYRKRNYSPEKVASAVVREMERHRSRLVLVSPESRLMYHATRLCPSLSRVIARAAARRMFGATEAARRIR